MAVVVDNGHDAVSANLVMVFSDAPTNDIAIREISQWARENGFVRPNEYHLQTRRAADGRTLFQSVCYRLDEGNVRAANEYLERVALRREAMPQMDLELVSK